MKANRTRSPDMAPPPTASADTTPSRPTPAVTGGASGSRLRIKPARVTLGLPALRTTTTNGGPARPDVDGSLRPAQPASARPMSAERNEGAAQRFRAGMGALHRVAEEARGLPGTPDTLAGVRSEVGFRHAVQSMFGNAAASPALENLLLGAVPAAAEGTAPYALPLTLATALRSIGVDSLQGAEAVLIASTRGEHLLRTLEVNAQGQTRRAIVAMSRGEHFLPEHEQQLFCLERVLAATVPGTQALAHLRHLQDKPQELQALRDSLVICSALQDKGVDLNAHTEPQDVLRHLEALPGLKMDEPIGRDDDQPLQLLAKALRHSQVRWPDDRAAFTAWKQGGFTESGKGTPFNHTTERLHKFLSYVDRADHGPRTLGNMARDARAWLGRTVGVGKSPLTPTRHGAQGTDRGLLQHEVAKYQAGLQRALGTAVDNLVDELRDPGLQQDHARRDKHLAHTAVLDLWRETGQTRLPLADVHRRANELLRQVHPQPDHVSAAVLQPHLRLFGRKARDSDGAPVVQVGIAALQAAGAARRRGAASGTVGAGAVADPEAIHREIQELRARPGNHDGKRQELARLQGQRRQLVMEMVEDIRSIQEARVDTKPLFKFSDLKVLFRGTPREGPTAADAQAVMNSIARAPYESSSTFADGASRGVGTFGVLLLGSGATLGTPLVYPIVQAEASRRAQVSLGVSNTGARLYVGTESAKSASLGVGAGWATPPLANNKISAAVLADASVNRSVSHGEGAVITARNDLPGWQEKLPQVVDFMFDQARLPKGDGAAHRAQDGAELWQRFANRFGDDPHLAVGWSTERSASTAGQVGALAVARVAAGATTSIGPSVSVGLRVQGSQFQRTPHANSADVPVAVRNRSVVASASTGVSQTLPAAVPGSTPPGPGAVAGWGAAAPFLGATVELDVAGSLGVARLGRTREGQLSASLCHREVLFQQPQRLIEYANLHRDLWEAGIVAQDPQAVTTPEVARDRLNSFLEQMAALPPQDAALHGELRALKQPVVEQINTLEARLATLTGQGDSAAKARALPASEKAECRAIEHEVHRLLQAEGSWQPSFMYAAEFNQTGSTSGLSFGLRAVNQEQATGVRPTALLVASLAHV